MGGHSVAARTIAVAIALYYACDFTTLIDVIVDSRLCRISRLEPGSNAVSPSNTFVGCKAEN